MKRSFRLRFPPFGIMGGSFFFRGIFLYTAIVVSNVYMYHRRKNILQISFLSKLSRRFLLLRILLRSRGIGGMIFV